MCVLVDAIEIARVPHRSLPFATTTPNIDPTTQAKTKKKTKKKKKKMMMFVLMMVSLLMAQRMERVGAIERLTRRHLQQMTRGEVVFDSD